MALASSWTKAFHYNSSLARHSRFSLKFAQGLMSTSLCICIRRRNVEKTFVLYDISSQVFRIVRHHIGRNVLLISIKLSAINFYYKTLFQCKIFVLFYILLSKSCMLEKDIVACF
ncbi:hypothetical protein C4Q31_05580 [Leptospira borgpetersenii serovar Ceylonica]|nr:hypothetical protein C4Q31_05580 [Leptospira borgpetersenii serovar Ceylonica]